MNETLITQASPSSKCNAEDMERFRTSTRIYLETSAFNYFADEFSLPDLELTRAYQRQKGVIFVTSPTLLWEIMLNSDRERADMLLLAAQALFDPVLLATPTELTVRYLQSAYPDNAVNYDVTAGPPWANRWPAMTRDFNRTIIYDFDDLIRKTSGLRSVSKNLACIMNGTDHPLEIVRLTGQFVSTVYEAISEDIQSWGLNQEVAKFVILYAFLILMVYADMDGTPAEDFWIEKGFHGERKHDVIIHTFFEYPEIFRQGPVLSMAIMAAIQHADGKTNRGAILDGMHMVYTPHVDTILSNDGAFLKLAQGVPYFREKVRHMSEIALRRVSLPLNDYPDDQKLRFFE
jgi:hypothetical protein